MKTHADPGNPELCDRLKTYFVQEALKSTPKRRREDRHREQWTAESAPHWTSVGTNSPHLY